MRTLVINFKYLLFYIIFTTSIFSTVKSNKTEDEGDCMEFEIGDPVHGRGYNGSISITANNYTCQRWDVDFPHKIPRNIRNYFLRDMNINHNYCRNLKDHERSPWCYTTDPNKYRDLCSQIKHCPSRIPKTEATGPNCRMNEFGIGYQGNQSTTASGYTCQNWMANTPTQIPTTVRNVLLDNKKINNNYCRNWEAKASNPWCYTTTPRQLVKEECNIPLCKGVKSSSITVIENMRGLLNKNHLKEEQQNKSRSHKITKNCKESTSITKKGHRCQYWDSKSPHKISKSLKRLFDHNKFPHDNFCRAFKNGKSSKPWCYTTDLRVKWQYCKVQNCKFLQKKRKLRKKIHKSPRISVTRLHNLHLESYKTPQKDCFELKNNQIFYNGTVSTTKRGYKCQNWQSSTPHKVRPNLLKKMRYIGDHNYCRTFSTRPIRPWCYHIHGNAKKVWGYCGVDRC